MIGISDCKNAALRSLEGKWGGAVILTLVYCVAAMFLSYVFMYVGRMLGLDAQEASNFSSLMLTLAFMPVSYGFYIEFLDLVRGGECKIGRMFSYYSQYVRLLLTILLVAVGVVVGIFLLIIPGIYFALCVSQLYFVLRDNPNLGPIEVLKKSNELMKGHKWNYLFFQLSFIGWVLLCLVTLGIGFIFLIPYMYTASAHYYENLVAEQETAM